MSHWYNPCVANKIVNGKQLTVVWHVDDLKVSHVEPLVVTRMANWLWQTYKLLFEDGLGKMKITPGKKHDYLGMLLDYAIKGKVKISMVLYVKDMLKCFYDHDQSTKTTATPTADQIFQVDERLKLLPPPMA